MADTTVSIIGLGWLGLPLAKQLQLTGNKVKGSATSSGKVFDLNQAGIEAYQLQLNPAPVGDLNSLLDADTLVINVPPKAGKFGEGFHPQQIQQLTEAINVSDIKHIIYVSSTSVYPELNRVVVEDDVTTPGQSAAPALVQAEHLVLALAPKKAVTVLRCGGLMGYDRIPGKYIAGKTVDSGDVPVNYLHQDDAVGILLTLIQQRLEGVFNAVAPEHPLRRDIYQKSCADFDYQLPTFKQPDHPVPYKVVSVEKLLQVTQYTFSYPDPLQFFYQLGTK
jgi:nucleoside-diphosphate-sugar epimerase